MSIIAETLSRLQTQRSSGTPVEPSQPESEVPEWSSPPTPTPAPAPENRGPSKRKVFVLGALFLLALGLVAAGMFWFGFNLLSDTPTLRGGLHRSESIEVLQPISPDTGFSPKNTEPPPPVPSQSVAQPVEKNIPDSANIGVRDVLPEKPITPTKDVPLESNAVTKKSAVKGLLPLSALQPPAASSVKNPVKKISPPTPIAKKPVAKPDTTPPQASSRKKATSLGNSSETLPASFQVPPSFTSTSWQRVEEARTLIRGKQFAEARERLAPFLLSSSNEWEVWSLLGTAELGLGNIVVAERHLDKALAQNPAEVSIWIQRAIVEQEQRNFGQAIALLKQAERLDPDSPEIHLNLGYSMEAQGRIRPAREHYQTYLSLTDHTHHDSALRMKVVERFSTLLGKEIQQRESPRSP